MLLKSLFCLHGRDSRPRFVAISVGVYACISIAAAAFGANFLLLLLALLGLPLLGLASVRRLVDANKPQVFVAVFLLPLLIYIVLLLAGAHVAFIGLWLVLAAGLTFWGWRLPAPTIVDYHFGYFGPKLAVPTSQAMPRRRVEPTIDPKLTTHLATKAATNVQAQPDAEEDEPQLESAPIQHLNVEVMPDPQARTFAHVDPVSAAAPVIDAELEVRRQDELRFDALTRMTQNPADFIVPDAYADFRPANASRVEHANIELVDVDIAKVDLKHTDFNQAQFDPADHSAEPGWHFAPDDEPDSFNDIDHAEEVRQRRAAAKDSGSMTELFRGLLEFVAPLKRYFVLPKLKLKFKPKFTLAMPDRRYWRPAGIGLSVVFLALLLWGLWPSGDDTDVSVATVHAVAPYAGDRVTLALPDGFSVALEDDVLIVRWLGEQGKAQNLWSLATAKGDKTCSVLAFNNGTDYRPVTVDLQADSATEARFSPLDAQAIIVDLAHRGSISLCGYKFSLKGSQAMLEQNRAFGTYLAR